MPKLISRDPFSRTELFSKVVNKQECDWCGQPAKYKYYIETDSGRRSDIRGVFCSISCMRNFNGE
jgi:hypothetical protein